MVNISLIGFLEEREPLYRSTAEIVVDTTGKQSHEIARIIYEDLKARGSIA